ncbi:MAG: Asp-tRNA(Asn)/Glu-tRNA(Gln) amidotransferase subunit GatA [Zoogloeaceae bacterium]|nr:Asp-tRNA(Asn)/Glu-tRNA(Gln) amidotransferase subunit GatA [Rhodocyclaceae bacterium]MCP5237674.1 Asp-tRNA(Asn)/Glu-tRNA(Gln) amidotransferase subunit GatA [Zoogloeaceae bacterium]
MLNASLQELASALADRRISSVELTRSVLDRIAAANPRTNAFVHVDGDGALAAAAAADARIAAGEAGPLTGIPLAHKDVFCTEGMPTTCASKMLANFVSPYDAHVVAQLKKAGTVLVGKTNMDEFAMGSSNENSHFGAARNPWDTSRVPGGSSGGSAAAVADGLIPIATGTDTGGSVRQPASFCGVTGIKPTYGVVSRYGMIAYASSLDQGGVLGRSAADCAPVLSAMAGFDPRDSTSLERPAEDFGRDLGKSIEGLKIGLPREYFGEGMDADVRAAVEAALDTYRSLGAVTVDIELPNSRLAIPAYYVIAPAEASSNLSRFDGVRYGHRAAEYADLAEMYCRSRAQGFGSEVKRRILIGTYVLSHGYYDAYYLQAQKLRRLIADDFRRAFGQCDVIAGPTAPTTAYALGAKCDDPVQMYLGDIYTVAINLAGLPALSLPAGFGDGGLPVGLQLIGDYFAEARLLNAAHRFQQATDWHLARPAGE